jgi:hypothetical protein
MAISLGQIISIAYSDMLRTTPWDMDWLQEYLDPGYRRPLYRDWLVRPRFNFAGKRISQIDIVKGNLRALGKTRAGYPPR